MLKRLINQAQIHIIINPLDPMLIKSGQATIGGTDMTFVRTYKKGEPEPFLPGSSLKGVIRSYCEKICRSLRPSPLPVCLPYLEKKDANTKEELDQLSCGHLLTKYETSDRKVNSIDAYKLSCPACRFFGSLKFTGRCSVSDANATERPLTEQRDGVAIDRITGGTAKGAKYDLEVLVKGNFEAHIQVRNFERWQLGLLGLALKDMQQGLVRLGSGKSRGLGRFEASINSFTLSYYNKEVKKITGLYGLCSEQEKMDYALASEVSTNDQSELPPPEKNGLRFDYAIESNWSEILEPGVKDFQEYIYNVNWPKDLHDYVQQGGAR